MIDFESPEAHRRKMVGKSPYHSEGDQSETSDDDCTILNVKHNNSASKRSNYTNTSVVVLDNDNISRNVDTMDDQESMASANSSGNVDYYRSTSSVQNKFTRHHRKTRGKKGDGSVNNYDNGS